MRMMVTFGGLSNESKPKWEAPYMIMGFTFGGLFNESNALCVC